MNSQQVMRRNQNSFYSRSWQEMFPNPQLTEQASQIFLKKLVAIAISNITYLRNMFPEGAFADRYLEGLNLKVLRDDGDFPAVSQLIKWIKGSFEALDHQYLRQLIIGIYKDGSNPNNVLETYSFHFTYTNNTLSGCSYYQDDGKNKRELVTGKLVSPEETYRQTLSLFRTCILCTNSLKPLPQDAMINLRLLYYDEVTPEDYEPPGFKPSPVTSYTFVNNPILLNMGQTDTPWHSMKLLIATDASDFEVSGKSSSNPIDYNTPSEVTQSEKRKTPTQTENFTNPPQLETPASGKPSSKRNASQYSQNAVVPTISPDQPASAISTTGSSLVEGSEPQLQQQVRCPCGVAQDEGLMIICKKCKFWQHASCFKILLEEEAVENHICELCHDSNSPCTDISLPPLMPNQRKEICLYRRALVFSSEHYRICDKDLADDLAIDVNMAQNIIKKLDKDGVLKLTSKRSKGRYRLINKYNLKKSVIPLYFSENQESKSTSKNVTFKDRGTAENPSDLAMSESIEKMTEKMTISSASGGSNTPKSSNLDKKAQKRNLLRETEDVTELISSDEDGDGPTKKKCKISVSDPFIS